MRKLLKEAVARQASDLHLTVGAPPFLRLHGEIALMGEEPLTPETCKALISEVINQEQMAEFEREWELCFSLSLAELGYFRVTVYYQRGAMEAAVRIGRLRARTCEELGLPQALEELTRKPNGLILITGPTGSGKTTSLNALINAINQVRRSKIVTIEDPIELVHTNLKSIVVQQEVHSDTKSFARALRHALRMDPDVIGIG